MIRKRLLSACLALALCLSLLPVTALAAENAPSTLTVGNVTVDTSQGGYWTTDTGGNLAPGNESNYNVHYDTGSNTLTLNGSTITASNASGNNTSMAGIYASASADQPVSLTIVLQGENKVSGSIGIYVYSSTTGGASLTITGEEGSSLTASGNQTGIQVQSNSGDATLSIQDAEVEATVSSVGGRGVLVRAGGSSNASLTVDGGSLTATSGRVYAGIEFLFGNSESGSGTPSLNVSSNAIVKASGGAGGITSNSSPVAPSGTGIVFNNDTGTVYGSVELQENLTIGDGERLTLAENASLTAGSHNVIVDGGTLGEGLENSLGNSVKYTPTITTTSPLPNGTVSQSYTAQLSATGSDTIKWSLAEGNTLPANLTLSESGTITSTPTTTGTSTFTVTATNAYGSDSKQFTLTIDEQGTVHVTGVSLNKTTLELTEGGTSTLTATVEPNNATNQTVTWSSDNESVATVNNGAVTAVKAGTATITVTTQDGSKTATCRVTVSVPYIPVPTYAIAVESSGNGTVRASASRAAAGSRVTLTVSPGEGYALDVLTVTDGSGSALTLTEQGEGRYTFIMPGRQVTVSAAFACTGQTGLCPSRAYADVDIGAWYHGALDYVLENGLMVGTSDTTFEPEAAMSRAQLVTILWRLAGEPAASGANAFDDVAAGEWYAEAVAWAAENGIVLGTGDATYSPGDLVSREQLAAILYRYAVYQGYDVSIGEDTNILSYDDFADLSEWAIPAMQWSCGAGIIQGTSESTLTPQGDAARAQVAAMLQRFCEGVVQERS